MGKLLIILSFTFLPIWTKAQMSFGPFVGFSYSNTGQAPRIGAELELNRHILTAGVSTLLNTPAGDNNKIFIGNFHGRDFSENVGLWLNYRYKTIQTNEYVSVDFGLDLHYHNNLRVHSTFQAVSEVRPDGTPLYVVGVYETDPNIKTLEASVFTGITSELTNDFSISVSGGIGFSMYNSLPSIFWVTTGGPRAFEVIPFYGTIGLTYKVFNKY